MKKIVRILGLIQQINQKKHLSKRQKRQLIKTLLFLEYKSYTKAGYNETVTISILDFTFSGYGYENLCILFREIFVQEEYQYFSTASNNPVIVDCGANIGMATLYLKWRFPNATIHSFEPDPSAFGMLERNTKTNNLQNVFLYNNAAMAEEGELDFYTAASHKASLMMSTVASRMDEQKITVKGIDFADFLNKTRPTLLKIDIEGAEKKVFPKLKETGAFNHLQQIIMEYHHMIDRSGSDFSKMLQILEESGFEYNLITHFNEPGTFQDILLYAFKPQK